MQPTGIDIFLTYYLLIEQQDIETLFYLLLLIYNYFRTESISRAHEIREEALRNIKMAQKKNIKNDTMKKLKKTYILIYQSKREQRLGPYYIHDVLHNGAYKLRNTERCH